MFTAQIDLSFPKLGGIAALEYRRKVGLPDSTADLTTNRNYRTKITLTEAEARESGRFENASEVIYCGVAAEFFAGRLTESEPRGIQVVQDLTGAELLEAVRKHTAKEEAERQAREAKEAIESEARRISKIESDNKYLRARIEQLEADLEEARGEADE